VQPEIMDVLPKRMEVVVCGWPWAPDGLPTQSTAASAKPHHFLCLVSQVGRGPPSLAFPCMGRCRDAGPKVGPGGPDPTQKAALVLSKPYRIVLSASRRRIRAKAQSYQ
jgi:hypothetical protein